MKRDRVAEAEQHLQDAEARLTKTLFGLLPEVAVSGASLFTNSFHNPHKFSAEKIWSQAQTVYEDALACVKARTSLGLPLENSVGQFFLAACEEAAGANEQRRGPRKLAASLMEQLDNEA